MVPLTRQECIEVSSTSWGCIAESYQRSMSVIVLSISFLVGLKVGQFVVFECNMVMVHVYSCNIIINMNRENRLEIESFYEN